MTTLMLKDLTPSQRKRLDARARARPDETLAEREKRLDIERKRWDPKPRYGQHALRPWWQRKKNNDDEIPRRPDPLWGRGSGSS